MISGNRRDSVGGGVVPEFFRDLQQPTWFSGGGGGSDRIFPFFRDLQLRNQFVYPTLSDIRG